MAQMLEPAGLGEQQLSSTLGSMMRGGVDYADLYFQTSRSESWTVEDRIIREGSFSLDQGVGVRAVSGEKTGLAYSDELLLPALEQAAGAARAIARQGESQAVQAWDRRQESLRYPSADPTTSLTDAQKTAFLGELEQATRDLDDRIEQVWFAGVHSNVGGGYPKQGMSLVPLCWMMQKAADQGLRFLDAAFRLYWQQMNVDDKLYDPRAGLAVYYRYQPRDIAKICAANGAVEPKIHVSVMLSLIHI